MKETYELLYEIAYKELDSERERKFKIETKAQRYGTFTGILFSVISSYFFIFGRNFNPEMQELNFWTKILLISALISLFIAFFLLTYSMKTFKDIVFDVRELIKEAHKDKLDVAMKKITGSLSNYIDIKRKSNMLQARYLFLGINFFFLSLILIILGTICSIFSL